MKLIGRITAAVVGLCTCFCFSACGNKGNESTRVPAGESGGEARGEWIDDLIATGLDYGQDLSGGTASSEDTLVVDLHTHMPTVDGTVSATKSIAQGFYEKTGVKVKFVTDKDLKGEQASASEWLIKKVQNEKMPAISFSWSAFTDRNYYMYLDDVMQLPNAFVSEGDGSEHWKDMFPEYLWTQKEQVDANGKIIAVPITLNPGSATCWFYNKSLYEKFGLSVPKNFTEFLANTKKVTGTVTDSDGKEVKAYAIAPYGNQLEINVNNWINKFSIGPSFAAYLMKNTDIDLDKDGVLSEYEQLRGVIKGYFDPTDDAPYKEVARDYYRISKDYYKNYLADGWMNTDWQTKWNQGSVANINNGVWQFRNEFNAEAVHESWDFGMFPAPLADSSVSPYALDFETSQGPSKSTSSLYVNVMKDGIKGNKTILKNAILFLQYLTTVDCVDYIIQENGAELGAVKGTTPDRMLSEYWLDQTFPVTPDCLWPDAYTTQQNNFLNSNFSRWVNGSIGDGEFYSAVAQYQLKGAQDYMKNLGIDYSAF